mmetsp:Transcript_4065/g.9945  ORF Transcript_4065/g.9945 Transcript_4065/m.9945 type:complete len:256 (+) Transcript_4065:2415-3182(+)
MNLLTRSSFSVNSDKSSPSLGFAAAALFIPASFPAAASEALTLREDVALDELEPDELPPLPLNTGSMANPFACDSKKFWWSNRNRPTNPHSPLQFWSGKLIAPAAFGVRTRGGPGPPPPAATTATAPLGAGAAPLGAADFAAGLLSPSPSPISVKNVFPPPGDPPPDLAAAPPFFASSSAFAPFPSAPVSAAAARTGLAAAAPNNATTASSPFSSTHHCRNSLPYRTPISGKSDIPWCTNICSGLPMPFTVYSCI